MTIDEYRSWLAFYEEEPFGDVRADLRAGIVGALIARTMGGRKGAKPMDYMPIVAGQMRADEASMGIDARTRQMRQSFEGNLGPLRVRKIALERVKE